MCVRVRLRVWGRFSFNTHPTTNAQTPTLTYTVPTLLGSTTSVFYAPPLSSSKLPFLLLPLTFFLPPRLSLPRPSFFHVTPPSRRTRPEPFPIAL